jgi:DNA-binding response OmpR family regulator
MEELIVRIENALRIKKGNGTAITTETLHIGKYRFNLNRQTLQFNNEERRLSYREQNCLNIYGKTVTALSTERIY